MFFYEGQTCPVCGQFFGEADDIVTCPECGAPHHRECWRSEGHCHFAHLHGTDKQWHQETETPKTVKKRCARCGSDNPEFAEFCAHCGMDLNAPDWQSGPSASAYDRPRESQYTPPTGNSFGFTPVGQPADPYGGVPRTETIDGVPVDTVAQMLGPNSAYYLPRFYNMTHGGSKVSWNWAAFLFSYNWLLYRKNMLFGSIAFVASMVFSLISNLAMGQLQSLANAATMDALIQAANRIMSTREGMLLWSIASLASLLLLLLRVAIGVFGNYLYLRTVLRRIKKNGNEPLSPYDQHFQKSGGVSFALAAAPEILIIAAEYILFFIFQI
ncbi:MAG: hypothetical protein IJP14_04210 [Clostridia bacterium]|nr:hypothetical protein [Clostridia bacterium]